MITIVNIYIVELTFIMLHIPTPRVVDPLNLEKKIFLKNFTLYGHGSHFVMWPRHSQFTLSLLMDASCEI